LVTLIQYLKPKFNDFGFFMPKGLYPSSSPHKYLLNTNEFRHSSRLTDLPCAK
jgi:hypothetical protein